MAKWLHADQKLRSRLPCVGLCTPSPPPHRMRLRGAPSLNPAKTLSSLTLACVLAVREDTKHQRQSPQNSDPRRPPPPNHQGLVPTPPSPKSIGQYIGNAMHAVRRLCRCGRHPLAPEFSNRCSQHFSAMAQMMASGCRGLGRTGLGRGWAGMHKKGRDLRGGPRSS